MTIKKKMEIKERIINEPETQSQGLYFADVSKKNLEFIPSGCKLMDCVLGGGFPLGRMSNIVGDKSSGKCVKHAFILEKNTGMVKLDSLGVELDPYEEPIPFENEVEVASFGNTVSQSSHFYKEVKNNQLLKITSKYGFELEGSKNHPILVLQKKGYLTFKTLDTLEVGDFVAISKNTQIFGNQIIDDKILKKLVNCLLDEKDINFLDLNFKLLLQATKEVQLRFLSKLFIDNYINLEKNPSTFYFYISFSENYKKYIQQLQLILLNLGVVSRISITEDGRNYFLKIRKSNAVLLNKLLNYEIKDSSAMFENDKTQKIPFLLEKLLSYMSTYSISQNEFNLINYPFITFEILQNFVEKFNHFDDEYILDFKNLANSNLFFDKLTRIQTVTYPDKTTTYDLHVPKTHMFWSNGFVSHNTLVAIEACANFKINFPTGKIYYLESEAAFDKDYAKSLGMPTESITFVDDSEDGLLKDYTIESWFENLEQVFKEALEHKEPVLYIVDSLDALSDRAEKGRKIDEGSFGANKPKKIGELFRRLTKDIEHSRLHLMIISQIRDNLSATFGEKYTRTGGKAMDFYASQILWLAHIQQLKKVIKGQTKIIGVQVKVKCKKNKVGLPFRECEYPILFGYGIDDITAMLTYIHGCKEEEKLVILFEGETSLEKQLKIIKALSKEDRKILRVKLENITVSLWQEIEEGFLPKDSKY